MQPTYIDLGLPSGTLWAAKNEPGYHQIDEALKTFKKQLPSPKAWKELFNQCSREWEKDHNGYLLTGPNGNTLFLPADGYQGWNSTTKELIPANRGGIEYMGRFGYYWAFSSDITVCTNYMRFNMHFVDPGDYNYIKNLDAFSVRLCKQA